MRTLRFYCTLAYYLVRYGRKMMNDAKKLHSEKKPIEAYRSIDKIESKGMRAVLKAAGATITTKGIENIDPDETYLFVANHQGNFDIPILYTVSPIKMAFVAKQEMGKWPIIGNLMKQRGCIFINRENPREGVKSIQEGIELLKSGESLAIFPEGARSKKNQMNSFKPGGLRMAIKSGVKVVPVVIKGSYKLMEENKGKVKSATVEVEFLSPVESRKYKEATQLSSDIELLIKQSLEN